MPPSPHPNALQGSFLTFWITYYVAVCVGIILVGWVGAKGRGGGAGTGGPEGGRSLWMHGQAQRCCCLLFCRTRSLKGLQHTHSPASKGLLV